MRTTLIFAALALAACSSTLATSRSTSVAPAEESAGLGTSWGELRHSPVREVPFERSSEQPSQVVSIYYNDLEGVKALAARLGATPLAAPVPVEGGLVAAVLDEFGEPLPAVSVGGRVYVVGRAGMRYTLEVKNLAGHRYEVVASVDGLDVVDGQPAGFEKRGYIVSPGGSLSIDGFRRSDSDVAAFRFGASADSYAAQMGAGRDVGVIGLAFFGERPLPVASEDEELGRRHSAAAFADTRPVY